MLEIRISPLDQEKRYQVRLQTEVRLNDQNKTRDSSLIIIALWNLCNHLIHQKIDLIEIKLLHQLRNHTQM